MLREELRLLITEGRHDFLPWDIARRTRLALLGAPFERVGARLLLAAEGMAAVAGAIALDPGLIDEVLGTRSGLWSLLQHLGEDDPRGRRDMVWNAELIIRYLFVKVFVIFTSVGKTATEEGKE